MSEKRFAHVMFTVSFFSLTVYFAVTLRNVDQTLMCLQAYRAKHNRVTITYSAGSSGTCCLMNLPTARIIDKTLDPFNPLFCNHV